MPHLIIEYSANVSGVVDIGAVVEALHNSAVATGIAPIDALRTRAVERTLYAIADRQPDNAFIAVTVRLAEGRSRQELGVLLESLMSALDVTLGQAQRNIMLSVECQEIVAGLRINKNNLRSVIAERTQHPESNGRALERNVHGDRSLSQRPGVQK